VEVLEGTSVESEVEVTESAVGVLVFSTPVGFCVGVEVVPTGGRQLTKDKITKIKNKVDVTR
jgi:hypothetical protein